MKMELHQILKPRRRGSIEPRQPRVFGAHFSVYPRYTPGSPGMVDESTARRVAEEERYSHGVALSGFWGDRQRERAEALGLLGIAEIVEELRKGWRVTDLVRGDVYERPFAEKMRPLWSTWYELNDHQKQLVTAEFPHHADQALREPHRWFFRLYMKDNWTATWTVEVWQLWREALEALSK